MNSREQQNIFYKACQVLRDKGFIVQPQAGEKILVSGNGFADFSISFSDGNMLMYLDTDRGGLYAQLFHDDVNRYLISKPFLGELKDGTPLAEAICQHAHTGDEIFQINQREYLVRPVGLSQFLHLTETSPGGPVSTVPLNQSA